MNLNKSIELFLHPLESNKKNSLVKKYKKALKSAKKLYIVSAYLTDWNSKEFIFNDNYDDFKFIIGQDFGITRKHACSNVIMSLPPKLKDKFYVVKTSNVKGFHPKAIFWENDKNRYFALVGSSNLTKAAFEKNHEANVYTEISKQQFEEIIDWLNKINKHCQVVTNEWIKNYKETSRIHPQNLANSLNKDEKSHIIQERRIILANFDKVKQDIIRLFESCCNKKISSEEFYMQLNNLWNVERKNRLQGKGWERTGKHSDFQKLSESFVIINNKHKQYEKKECSRRSLDNVVAKELDKLKEFKIPTRKSFFTEILCLMYPSLYPITNKPVSKFIQNNGLFQYKKLSEGTKYIELAKKFRKKVVTDDYTINNLLEWDSIIWASYNDN